MTHKGYFSNAQIFSLQMSNVVRLARKFLVCVINDNYTPLKLFANLWTFCVFSFLDRRPESQMTHLIRFSFLL